MNKIYVLPEDDLRGGLYRRAYLLVSMEGGGWKSGGAAFGLAGGLLSVPLAVALWAAARFTGPFGVGPALHALSTALFVLNLPLLALGAYFLDLLEGRPPAPPPPAQPRGSATRTAAPPAGRLSSPPAPGCSRPAA